MASQPDTVDATPVPGPEPLPRRLDKRVFDLLALFLLAPVLVPLVLGLLLMMALDMLLHPASRGPFLYRETRISQGRRFTMYKFRCVKQSVIDAALASPEGLVTLKRLEKQPENFTWLGRLLIRFYLDELGQVFNILLGDMTLVGPRPWPPAEYAAHLDRVGPTKGRVPCGLCGPVQSGKGDAQLQYHVAEADYVAAYASLGTLGMIRLDLHHMWQTFMKQLRGEGL